MQSKRFPLATKTGRQMGVSLRKAGFGDLYHYLLTSSWHYLLFLIGITFGVVNLIFALGYFLDGGILNARAHSFADSFFFSVQTMATIGYGRMAPVTTFANILVSIEALFGLMALALVTGLVFAKFSRPTARVRFSRYAVVTPREGVPCLMFRMANVRANQIVEAQIHAVLGRQEVTAEGETIRRLYDLELERYRNAVFVLSWTAVHPIRESSPLHGASTESLERDDASIVVSLTGLDGTFSQTVHARHNYAARDIVFGSRLADIMHRLPGGELVYDYDRFDDLVPLDRKNPEDESSMPPSTGSLS